MATYRIVCTDQTQGSTHGHITGVGLGDDPNQAGSRMAVDAVRTAIMNGDQFYTVGATSGRTAYVERFDCWCGVKTIRSIPDQVIDNNLDSMRLCRWNS